MSQHRTERARNAPEPSDPDHIRASIAAARAELGDTVDQLAAKLDLKAQASAQITDLTDRATQSAKQAWQSAPPQAQHAVAAAADTLGPTARQLSTRARPHRTKFAAGAAVLLLAIIVRRRRPGGQS
jgi:hypothetical protein